MKKMSDIIEYQGNKNWNWRFHFTLTRKAKIETDNSVGKDLE